MNNRQVMVLASGLVMIAGSNMVFLHPDGGVRGDLGGIILMVGLVLFISSAVSMARQRS